MSRFPHQPFNIGRRNIARPAPRLGIQGSINTPGTIVLPPNAESSAQAEQIRKFLGVVDGLANQTTAFARSIAHAKETEIEENKIHMRGLASQESGLQSVIDLENIEEHYRGVTQNKGESFDYATVRYVDERFDNLTQGQTPTFIKEFDRWKLSLVRGILKQDKRVRRQARDELGAGTSSLIRNADSSEDIEGIRNEARDNSAYEGMSDVELDELIMLPALRDAAKGGDRKRFPMIVASLDSKQFFSQINDAIQVFDREVKRQDKETSDGVRDQVFGFLTERKYDSAIFAVELATNEGFIDSELGFLLSRKIEDVEKDNNREAIRLVEQQHLEEQRDAFLSQTYTAGESPGLRGGLRNVQDAILITLDGKEIRIPAKEFVDATIATKFQEIIDGEGTPEEKFADQLRYLSDNGILEYAPLSHKFNSVIGLVNDQTTDIPEPLIEATKMVIMGNSINKFLMRSLMSKDAREFYDNVLLHYKNSNDIEASILVASRPLDIKASISLSDVEKATRNITGDLRNDGEVNAWIREKTLAMMRETGSGSESALASVIDIYENTHRVFNGYAVDVTGRDIPNNVEDVSQQILEWYAGTKSTPEIPIDLNDITLRPREDGLWVVVDETGQQIGTESFTDAELVHRQG